MLEGVKGPPMQNADPIRVMCVDDHPLVRDGVRFALHQENDMQLVAEATNGLESLAAFRKFLPTITLMDVSMPLMDGLDAAAAIREEFPQAKIVILTRYAGDIKATRAFKLGAVGYLLKGLSRRELVDAIRAARSGIRRIPMEIASNIAEHVSADHLSEREIEVLREVAGGCANKVVAEKLLISEDTVKGHMKSILAKLRANDRTHAVMIGLKRGFLGCFETSGEAY
jgi:DNA-binding NarL/FixJ family response regulator